MKSKTKAKKTLLAWAVGLTFTIGVGVVTWVFGTQIGITSFPTLVQVCGWLINAVLRKVS